MINVILVSGTPGTGKTTIAKKVAKLKKSKYIDVNKIIKELNLFEGYDEDRDCYIIDTAKLNKKIIEIIKSSDKPLVIDSHLSHFLPKRYSRLVIITRCDIKELNKRLKDRKYKKDKIRENLDSEIFDICKEEARKIGHKIVEIDTTNGIKLKELKEKVS